jgi:hypothetical protein
MRRPPPNSNIDRADGLARIRAQRGDRRRVDEARFFRKSQGRIEQLQRHGFGFQFRIISRGRGPSRTSRPWEPLSLLKRIDGPAGLSGAIPLFRTKHGVGLPVEGPSGRGSVAEKTFTAFLPFNCRPIRF